MIIPICADLKKRKYAIWEKRYEKDIRYVSITQETL